MNVKKIVSCVVFAAAVLGLAALFVPTTADARPPIRCTIETGDPGCPPCTAWNSHLCRCTIIPSCKL